MHILTSILVAAEDVDESLTLSVRDGEIIM
jgi:hypothetical protein